MLLPSGAIRACPSRLANSYTFCCDLQGRRINFTNSKTLVSRPTVTRVDLPECKEPLKKIKENEKKRKQRKTKKINNENQFFKKKKN